MSERIDKGRLPGFVGYQLRLAHTRVFQRFAVLLEDLGITPGQVGLLLTVDANPGITQSALARELGVERSTLGEAVERLAARALVERRPAPHDKRSRAVHLTGEGQAFIERLLPRLEDHEARVTEGMSEQERASLVELLGRLAAG